MDMHPGDAKMVFLVPELAYACPPGKVFALSACIPDSQQRSAKLGLVLAGRLLLLLVRLGLPRGRILGCRRRCARARGGLGSRTPHPGGERV
jgi:hypothetical protein